MFVSDDEVEVDINFFNQNNDLCINSSLIDEDNIIRVVLQFDLKSDEEVFSLDSILFNNHEFPGIILNDKVAEYSVHSEVNGYSVFVNNGFEVNVDFEFHFVDNSDR